MPDEDKNRLVAFRLPKELLDRMPPAKGGRSEFLRQAVEEKLERSK